MMSIRYDMGRKGQITFFIIVGIVLLMLVLGLYVAINMVGKEEEGQQIEKVIQIADFDPLEEFVGSCVEMTVDDAFRLMGLQGGRLLSDVGGPVDIGSLIPGKDYIFSEEHDSNIAYSVKQYDVGIYAFSVEVPEYPYSSFPMLAGQYFPKGLYGYVSFLALEDSSDPKNIGTIKGQLIHYIEHKLPECTAGFINFPSFEVKEEKPDVDIDFFARSTAVKISYPLDVRKKTTNDFVEFENFDKNFGLSMPTVYGAAMELLHNEVADVTYSMEYKVFGTSKVAKIIPDISESHDNLAILEDTSYMIDGEPFTLNLLIRNRPPALHFIDPAGIPVLYLDYAINGEEDDPLVIKDSQGGLVYSMGDDVAAQPPAGQHLVAYDPDDADNYTVSYSPALPLAVQDYNIPPASDTMVLTVMVSDGEFTDSQTLDMVTAS